MVSMADQTAVSKISWLVRRRVWVQSLFLLLWLDPFMLRLHSVCGPVFHCYSCPLAVVACPIGIIANFSALHLFPFLAIGTLALVGSSIGTAVCGWACPFGLLQDLVGKVPTPKFKLPAWTGLTRYAVLISLVLVIPYLFGEEHPLFFCLVCPAGALEGAVPNAIKSASAGTGLMLPSIQKMIILGAILLAMLFTLRPWCSVFCPLGAIFSLFNRVSILRLRFRRDDCKQCGACDKMCRYDVLPAVDVNNAECIRCLECTRCDAITVGTVFDTTKQDAGGPAGGGQHC
jgi:ferredoxin-type protein NapH